MKAAGLFVGVSRLADPRIRELQFAHSDATTLHAIFADGNLEQQIPEEMCRLVVNESATKSGVLEALTATIDDARSGRADIVIIHFSCHGSPSGTFVLHDTDAGAVDASGLPVREVVDTLSSARDLPVILTLDCCFAGTALGLSDSPNRDAFNELMHRDQDQSRVVGCAAEFGQNAYEDREYGRGFFSHALATRLQEAHDAGDRRLSAFDWVHDAVGRTTELARTRGRSQAAVAFVTAREARAVLHVARSRPNQLRLIVPGELPPVTEDVGCLAGHGLDGPTIAALRTRLGPSGRLNELQRKAVEVGGVLRHQSVFVRAPTSAGKTLVAELAILGHQQSGRKAVVLLPLRALAREHARTFQAAYGSLGVRVIISTGDAHDEDDLLIRGQFEVAFLTFEKFCAIISARPELQESLGLIVFDELQTIADVGRGHTLELLLVQVRRWREMTHSQWPQLVVLCGELADLAPLQRWLNLPVVASSHRPIPLQEAVLRATSGEVRFLDREAGLERVETWSEAVSHLAVTDERARRRAAAVPVVGKLLTDGLQILVFCSEKPQARLMAQRLARNCGLASAAVLVAELDGLDPTTDHSTRAVLREIAVGGVGLHVADLSDGERNAVEDAFRRRELRVIVATSTLGQGVNLPADAVVFVDTERWNGTSSEPISVVDYRNTAGRAGRLIPNGPARGISVLVAQNQHSAEEMWDRYVTAVPAALGSSLGDLPNEDLVMLLLRQFESATVNDLTAALSATYWATTQRVDPAWRRARRAEMEESLGRLANTGLVAQVGDTGWRLTPVGRVAAGYGLSWRSAAAVAAGTRRLLATRERIDSLALLVLALVTEEVADCRCPRGNTPIPANAVGALSGRPVLWDVVTVDSDHGAAGNRLHKLEAIGKWFSGTGLREVEAFYAREASDSAVAGLLFNLLQRVSALLPAVAAIAWLDHPESERELRQDAQRLRAQLHIGGNRHAAALHRLRLGLTRGQCLALVRLGIQDLGALRDAVANRSDELAVILSTPGLERIAGLMGSRRHQARISMSEPQLALEGFE